MRVAPEDPRAPRQGWPPELQAIDHLIATAGPGVSHHIACEVEVRGLRLPVPVVTLGSDDPAAGAVGFFGGVHGLERIGAEVVIAFLGQVLARLRWDASLHHLLRSLRLVFMPLVNPGGLLLGTRANPQGVDLMRNAPLDCPDGAPAGVGGQRVSAALPWYRGPAGAPMQPEAQALCEVVSRELLPHRFAIALDCHSGFGFTDRLWFPYAHTREPLPQLPELAALAALIDETMPTHPYVIEPQSRQYLAHGDLWDHLLLQAQARGTDAVLLPLTLEMGSWRWVRKNPRQFFSRHGLFNPLVAHRQQRVLRRHAPLLDLLARAACSHAAWRPDEVDRAPWRQRGLQRWYGEGGA